MIMKQKKQFKELSDEELSQVTGGTQSYTTKDCRLAGGKTETVYPSDFECEVMCVIDGQAYPLSGSLIPKCVPPSAV